MLLDAVPDVGTDIAVVEYTTEPETVSAVKVEVWYCE